MGTLLFHKDVYMPDAAQGVAKRAQGQMSSFRYSAHFEEHLDNQMCEDRSHTYLRDAIEGCLKWLKDNPQESFEIELTQDSSRFGNSDWVLTKFCCRIPYDGTQDLVVAIRPTFTIGRGTKATGFMVVTAWMNSHTDNHYTLDRSKYCSEDDWNRAIGAVKK